MAKVSQRRVSKITKKQQALRQALWPDLDEARLWLRSVCVGFTTIPRTMPIIMSIMDGLSKGKPLGTTYMELWCRAYDECFVTLNKPHELASHSGFSGQRAVTTWKERMRILQELGFIDMKPGPSGDMSYALLLNPYQVIKQLYESKRPGLTAERYNTLVARAIDIGAADLDEI